MPLFRMVFQFSDHDRSFMDAVGPAFSGWLPNGETDAIKDVSSGTGVTLWFERRQKLFDSFYAFDWQEAESVTDEDIKDQIALDAGFLFMKAEFDIGGVDLERVADQRYSNAPESMTPDEKAVTDRAYSIFYPPFRALIERLRLEFGCYWLDAESVGNDDNEKRDWVYIHELAYKAVSGEWKRIFRSSRFTKIEIKLETGIPSYYSSYLLRSDWEQIRSQPQVTLFAPAAREMLVQARKRYEFKDFISSTILACTSLEILLNERVRRLTTREFAKSHDWVKSNMNKIDRLGLIGKMMIMKDALSVSEDEIAVFHELVEDRHKIVHQGAIDFGDQNAKRLYHAIARISDFFDDPPMKFPFRNHNLCRHRDFDGREH